MSDIKTVEEPEKPNEFHTSTSCEAYYRLLHTSCSTVVDATLTHPFADRLAISHGFIKDLERWSEVLTGRPEIPMLQAAMSEYQFALLSLLQGHYRHSFMSLRLTLELLLGCVHFSANEWELRMWLNGTKDLVWSAIVDEDKGVFATDFVKVFFESLAVEALHYGRLSGKIYRECSQYVHGNAETHTALPDSISFSQKMFDDWHDRAKSVRLATSFALCCRYALILETAKRAALEGVLLDNLGHLSEVRVMFGGSVEPETNA